ncbi:hypothetical protein FWK35_00009351, partial [Aphis craccivora]
VPSFLTSALKPLTSSAVYSTILLVPSVDIVSGIVVNAVVEVVWGWGVCGFWGVCLRC